MSRRENKKDTVYLYTDEEIDLFRINSSINPRTKRKIKKGGKIYNYLMTLIVQNARGSRSVSSKGEARSTALGSKEKNTILDQGAVQGEDQGADQGADQGELIMLNNPPKQIIKKLRENSLVPN